MMKKLLVTIALMLLAVLMYAQATVKTIPVTTSSKKALSLYKEAMNAYQDVDLNKYEDLLSKALAEDPDFFMAYYQKAILAAYINQEKNFIKDATSAVNCKSRISSGEKILKDATKLLLEDRKADLRSYGNKLVEMYPEDVNSYIQLMAYQYLIKDYDGQITTLNEAIKLQGRKDYLYNVLAYAYMGKGQFTEAEAALDKYISLSPDLPNPYDSKGDLYMMTKEYAKAYENFMKANSIDTTWSKGKALRAKNLTNQTKQFDLMRKFAGEWQQSETGKDTINLFEMTGYDNAFLQISSRIIKGVKRIQVTCTYTFDPAFQNFKTSAIYPNGQVETWRVDFKSDREVDFTRVEDLKTNTVMYRNSVIFDDGDHMTVNSYNKDNVRTATSKWINTNALTLDQAEKEKIIREAKDFVATLIQTCEKPDPELLKSFYDKSTDFVSMVGGQYAEYEQSLQGVDGYFANVASQKSTIRREKFVILDATTVLYTADSRWEVKLKNDSTMIMDPAGMQFLLKKIDNQWKVISWTEEVIVKN